MSQPADNLLQTDPGRSLLELLCKVMKHKLDAALLPPRIANPQFGDPVKEGQKPHPAVIANPEYVSMQAAEMSAVIRLLENNSVTLANIRRGDFGETMQRAADEFPFPAEAKLN